MSAQVDAFLEMWLYPYGTIGQIEISENGSTYETLTIASAMTVRQALAAWEAAADAWSPGAHKYEFAIDANGDLAIGSAGNWWLRVSESMADCLGLSNTTNAYTGSSTYSSDVTPKGWLAAGGIGFEALRSVEHVELREYTHGRTSAYHSRHGRMVTAAIHIDVDLVDDILDGPLGTHGKTRLFPTDSSASSAYGAAALEGYLDVWPIEVTDIDREQWGAAVIYVDCLLEEA